MPRPFARQIIELKRQEPAPWVADAANILAGPMTADNIILTAGKFSVVDVFDTNRYAHDPRVDFMNWSIIESGAFDYAADSWGYTYGGAIEWTQSWWSVRGGVFALSKVPNGKEIDGQFRQFSLISEFEERLRVPAHDGQDSGPMADTVPAAWRTVFRADGGHFWGQNGRVSAMISERCPP